MKYLQLIILVFISTQGYSQITFTGVKNSSSIKTNNENNSPEKNEVVFSKQNESTIQPKYVEIDPFFDARIVSKENSVAINIYNSKNIKGYKESDKPQIIIDLNLAKKQLGTDSRVSDSKIGKIKEAKSIKDDEIVATKEIENNISKQQKENNFDISIEEIETETNIVEKEVVIIEEKKEDIVVEKRIDKKEPKIKENTLKKNKEPLTVEKTNNSLFYKGKPDNTTTIKGKDITEELTFTNNEDLNIEKNEIVEETSIVNTNSSKIIEEEVPEIVVSEPLTIETTKEVEIIQKEKVIIPKSITEEKTSSIETSTTKETVHIKGTETKSIVNEPVALEKEIITKESSNTKSEENLTNEDQKNPKKGSWSIGLGFGVPVVIGDMHSKLGYGASLTIQKALGHVFSLRFQAIALETFGQDLSKSNGTFLNYKTRFTDYSLQGVFTLNNLNFYKKEPRIIYNFIGGAGLSTRHNWINQYDENNNLYSYDGISGSKSEKLKSLKDLMDKNYETVVSKDENEMSIKNTNISPSVILGLGIAFKVSKSIDINLESRMSFHFTDNLDAHTKGTAKDWLSFTTLGFTFKIPSKNESMLWANPVYSKVEEIEDLKKKVNDGDLLKDEDKDGIADIFDQDLNTPERVAVDSRGIPSDLDKDGVPDYKDSEPFTPLGAQVDVNGIALDADNDGIADVLDQENNTIPGSYVDANGRTIQNNKEEALSKIKSNSDFNLIFFDENSFKVKQEFYSDLYKISRHIQANPSAKIQITGHTDVLASEKFNLELSEKRANAVYSMLIELFKIPTKNLITKYLGEQEPIIKGLPEQKDNKLAPAYYINRRVEFKILK